MGRPSKYPRELRERAFRTVAEVPADYPSEYQAMAAVAQMRCRARSASVRSPHALDTHDQNGGKHMEHVAATCGIDWVENHHDIALVDTDGRVITIRRVGTDANEFSELLGLIAENGRDPESTPIAIETDNLFVVAVVGAGFSVHPGNPRALARYRERHRQAGGKSDPADAITLVYVLRIHKQLHRPLRVKAFARRQQKAICDLHQTVSRLRSVVVASAVIDSARRPPGQKQSSGNQ